MEIKRKLYRFYKWQYFWLFLIVIATLIMHFCIITNPSYPLFDEIHYVNDARSITENHTTMRQEHPPLGKLIIVGGMETFGDNVWGWRVFPILFGTVTIVLFYFLCRRFNMSPTASNIATFLLAFENLTFVQSSVAMLDVFYLTFMMAAFLLYACRNYIVSGIAIGLSGLAKLNGLLALPAVGIHWIFSRRPRSWWFLLLILFSILSFVELMIVFDLAITRNFSSVLDPIHRIREMESLSGSLTFATVTHPAASHPWEWVIRYMPMAYWYMPHFTGAISFNIWAMIIPTFIYMLFRAIKGSDAALFGLSWFAGTYLIWIPATLITDRVSYIFYFYPAIGAVCLGLGMALSQLIDYYRNGKTTWLKRTALIFFIFFIAAHLLSFIILSPVVPYDFGKLIGITPH